MDTMKQWLQKVAIPWKHAKIQKLELKHDQKGLLIFDCWSVHKQQEWIDACKNAGFEIVFIPAGYTDHFQPMDLTVNKNFKDNIRNSFDEFLVNLLTEQYQQSKELDLLLSLPDLKKNIVEWCDFSYNKIIVENKIVRLGKYSFIIFLLFFYYFLFFILLFYFLILKYRI